MKEDYHEEWDGKEGNGEERKSGEELGGGVKFLPGLQKGSSIRSEEEARKKERMHRERVAMETEEGENPE